MPCNGIRVRDVFQTHLKAIAGLQNRCSGIVGTGHKLSAVHIARVQRYGIQLGKLCHVIGCSVLVGFPLFEHVPRLGQGFNFNGHILEVNTVPRQWARNNGIDADQSSECRRDIQRALIIIWQPKAVHQMVARGVDPVLVVGHHGVDGVEPRPVRRRGIPSVDVVRHGCFNLIHGDVGFEGKRPRLENGVDQIRVPVDEPPSERSIAEHVIEEVAVHAGESRVARSVDVIVVDAAPEEPETCIGIVEEVFPGVLFGGAEYLGVVQSPSDAHPVHVLDVGFENEVVDVVIHVEDLLELSEEAGTHRGG